MRRASDLTRRELETVVDAVQKMIFLDRDDMGQPVWDPDSEVPGADLVEAVAWQLELAGLKPECVLPVEDTT